MKVRLTAVLAAALLACTPSFAGDKDIYIDLIEEAVAAYTPEQVEKYIGEVETYGIWEHGFARLTAGTGTLVAFGRAPEKKELLERMMDLCLREMPLAKAKNYDRRGSVGNDFAVKEIVQCIVDLEEAHVFPKETTDRWREQVTALEVQSTYSCLPPLKDTRAYNWVVFNCTSECARLWAGMGGDRDHVDRYFLDQLDWFDGNGMYMDPHQPILYDFVTRLQFMLALHYGYDGPARAAIEENLRKSALPTLWMQSASGEIPFGGRSNQFVYNETAYAAVCEYYAAWFRREGDYELASRFKAAAGKAVHSLEYWMSQKPVSHVKNRFPAAMGIGCEGYGYFDKYMVTMGSWARLAYLFADDSIAPSKKREPGAIFVTSDKFHQVIMNEGGYTVQFDLDAQKEYDSSGMGRFQREEAPSVIALSVPCPGAEKHNYKTDIDYEGPLSISPLWDSYELVKARRGCVVLSDGNGALWKCRLSRRGLRMTLSGMEEARLTLPALIFDGENSPEVECDGHSLTITFNGWQCIYSTDGVISDTGLTYCNRNGHLRRFDAVSRRGRLHVKGRIVPVG